MSSFKKFFLKQNEECLEQEQKIQNHSIGCPCVWIVTEDVSMSSKTTFGHLNTGKDDLSALPW